MEDAPFYADLAEGPDGGQAWWVKASDGVRLRVGYWPGGGKSTKKSAGKGTNRGTVLFFPGRTEYIEKYGRTAGHLRNRGYGMIAIDWRGQGLADRLADNPLLGHVGRFSDYQLDVAAMVKLAQEIDAPKPWYMIAHSMGGCIGLRALHEGLPVNAAVFSAPMWGIGMSPALRPFAWAGSWLSQYIGTGEKFAPGVLHQSYVLTSPFEGNDLTGDAEVFEYMKNHIRQKPAFALAGPSLHWLHQALMETRALRALPGPDYPAKTFLGGLEDIVDTSSPPQVMENWASGELIRVAGAKHEFPMEQAYIRDAFLDETCALFGENP